MPPLQRLRRRWLLAGAAGALASVGLLAFGRQIQISGRPWQSEGGPGPAEPPADAFCVRAPVLPYEAASGLGRFEARPIPSEARCPVCGMFPARAPEWAAQLIFQDGGVQFFDSPVSLLIYLRDVARYAPGRTAAEVAVRYVRDSRGSRSAPGAWLKADRAVLVAGSDALGPMRAGNLPAFADEAAARAFARERGGEPLPLNAVPDALLRRLDPRAHLLAHQHHARP